MSTPSDTEPTDHDEKQAEELGDGSPTGNATTDPDQDSDTASGGEPE